MEIVKECNLVTVNGTITSGLEYSHELMGELFYTFDIAIERTSKTIDTIKVMISDRMIELEKLVPGETVTIYGSYRSNNKVVNEKRRLLLFIFTKDIEVGARLLDCNSIEMMGYICKTPTYRKTPNGREIADVMLAVNRQYGKADYIPCIAWGRNARYTAGLEIGTLVSVKGRIQSRIYQKVTPDGLSEDKVTYEVSLSCIKAVDKERINEAN